MGYAPEEEYVPAGTPGGELPTYEAVVGQYNRLARLAVKHKGVVRDFYYPRRVHIPWRMWQTLIGMISNYAYKVCVEEGVETKNGRIPMDVIRARRSEIAKRVAQEIRIHIIRTGRVPTFVYTRPPYRLEEIVPVPVPVRR